tara:strand:+ start:1639 stop:1857 length:219 start_codon:yes stop_codon:yes gene_type:complete
VPTKEQEVIMGNKNQRQNQHMRRLNKKIRRFEKAGKSTAGLEKELAYTLGEERPAYKTGRDADPRFKKVRYD